MKTTKNVSKSPVKKAMYGTSMSSPTMKSGGQKKMGTGGMHMMPDGTMMKDSMMKMGGSLKPVSSDKKGLAKLPTAVRNKMGYKKTGGEIKSKKK